ncbi:MAG: hypothetical protein AAGA86_06695 [Bacteroidota bacterium]
MKKIVFLSLFGLALCSCSDDDDGTSMGNCDLGTVISESRFNDAPSDALTINTLSVEGDCLMINFSAGGCDGSSWEIVLIDSGAILESDPPQRNLRLSLNNEELCAAIVQRELTFDISNLRVEGNQVRLNLVNSEDSVLYSY